ncbi:MAG: M28 family peptidase [Lentimicrobiaceae bacterium]|nr:M28 family peptidase [Lentimicrobiaceae bacterium]
MKYKILYSFLLVFSIHLFSFAQYGYSPRIDSISRLVTEQSVSLTVRELSGDTSTLIGGQPYTITSRYYSSPQNAKAAQYIFEKFESSGLSPYYQNFQSGGTNIIAVKPGTLYPEKQFIICAHYDDMPSGSLAPGCDDNASGTVAVIEAARLLSPHNFDYTLIFAAWDAEEIGLVGSAYYADSVKNAGAEILGVLNLDMIAWDSDNDFKLSVAVDDQSQELSDKFSSVLRNYTPQLSESEMYVTASDHSSFWDQGYPALLSIENMDDFNAYYHTTNDKFETINVPYFKTMVQAAVATMAAFACDYSVDIQHTPLISGNDTSARQAVFAVTSSYPVAQSPNDPLLYYSVNNQDYNVLHATQTKQNNYTYTLPGQPIGTTVKYYFALQDLATNFVATLPGGGKGLNPPGTQSPEDVFIYQVANIVSNTFCSENIPVSLTDQEVTYDTIPVNVQGVVFDVNVEISIDHTYIGDLDIAVLSPEGNEVALSNGNGGNANAYIQTVFDDEASVAITNGYPPYTGSFTPEEPLTVFDGEPVNGNWLLKVSDNGPGDYGNLTGYCLHLQYSVDISGITIPINSETCNLSVFPNPASSAFVVTYEIKNPTIVDVAIFNMMGNKVADIYKGNISKGMYIHKMHTQNLVGGTYFIRIQTNKGIETRKICLIK